MKHLMALILTLAMLLGACAQADGQYGETLLAVAVSELGYTATKGGYSKYGEWGGNAYGQWCSEFVSWCVSRADEVYGLGMLENIYPMQTSCEAGVEWFKERGRYVTTSGEIAGEGEQFYIADGVSVKDRPYVPQAGDLIYIEWYKYNRIDHVGIVEFVTVDAQGVYWVHTIEGNNHILGPEPTVVGRYTYRLDDPSIRGYGVLQEGLVATHLTMGSKGAGVVTYQKSLKQLGYYDGDCAGKFGKGTQTATTAYQKAKGLPQTGEADAATQRCLTGEMTTLRIAAEADAKARAQEEEDKMVAQAIAAVDGAWFGEFDPYDEEAVWARLTADITVLDVDQKERVYLCDAPNGERKSYDSHRGFFYGESVAVRVLEEKDGWVKIEAYNDCDELEQGWVRAHRIKTVTPNQEYGIVVDKMTQRLYLYKDGKLVTTLLISTGTTKGSNEDYNETASGEFLLISATGGFWSGNLWCAQAIRFNGGDLLHMVPAVYYGEYGMGEPSGGGDFSVCESALGQRASHGCIRVQREKNEDGYNHQWLWNNLKYLRGIKIIVWDDDGRRLPVTAENTPMYYNPDGGEKYHTDQRCSSVRSAYLPLSEITYGDLRRYPFTSLRPCGSCSAPERPEKVDAWNGAIDQAYEILGLTP